MCRIEDKGCYNCKYMDQPGYMPPCDQCADPSGFGLEKPPKWEAAKDRGQRLASGPEGPTPRREVSLRPGEAYAPEGGQKERGREGKRRQGAGVRGQEETDIWKKPAAVWALWVAVGALREAADRMAMVGDDPGYVLHANQLRGAAGMAEGWIGGIEEEMKREVRCQRSEVRKRGKEEEREVRGRVLDEDDGYCN